MTRGHSIMSREPGCSAVTRPVQAGTWEFLGGGVQIAQCYIGRLAVIDRCTLWRDMKLVIKWYGEITEVFTHAAVLSLEVHISGDSTAEGGVARTANVELMIMIRKEKGLQESPNPTAVQFVLSSNKVSSLKAKEEKSYCKVKVQRWVNKDRWGRCAFKMNDLQNLISPSSSPRRFVPNLLKTPWCFICWGWASEIYCKVAVTLTSNSYNVLF